MMQHVRSKRNFYTSGARDRLVDSLRPRTRPKRRERGKVSERREMNLCHLHQWIIIYRSRGWIFVPERAAMDTRRISCPGYSPLPSTPPPPPPPLPLTYPRFPLPIFHGTTCWCGNAGNMANGVVADADAIETGDPAAPAPIATVDNDRGIIEDSLVSV